MPTPDGPTQQENTPASKSLRSMSRNAWEKTTQKDRSPKGSPGLVPLLVLDGLERPCDVNRGP
eukprot:11162628-Lingulodinium_polyedra.AAC.1